MRRAKHFLVVCAIWLLSVFVLESVPAQAQEQQKQEKVRVGFFQFDGYHDKDSRGVLSGYGYDFLQMIAGYSNFSYEYVGYDKSWEEMLEMLETGELDMLTFTKYTPERADLFEYSEMPVGYSAVVLTTTLQQSLLHAGDYSTYDGARIGMIKGSTQEEELQKFSQLHNFTYTPVYFDTLAELKNALFTTKAIDAMATNSVRKLGNERVLDYFDEKPFYVVVRKGNSQLIQQVDSAMAMMNTYNPLWRSQLEEIYFSVNMQMQSLDSPELKYLEELKASGGKLRVLINPDLKPYSYFEDGVAKGILVEYFEQICMRYGIIPEYIEVSNSKEYFTLATKEKGADIVLAPNVGRYEAEEAGYFLTRCFMDAPISVVMDNGRKKISSRGKIAVTSGMTSIIYAATNNFRGNEIVYYSTLDECVEAVRNGEVDGALMYTYCIYEYLNADWKNELTAQDVSDNSTGFSIAVPKTADTRLYVLMCIGINNVDDARVQSIIAQNLVSMNQNEPTWLYIYRHPAMFLSIVAVVVICIISLILLRNQKVKEEHTKKRKQAEYEANHDPLTGALNRSAYTKMLNDSEKNAGKIGVMMVDVDYFKHINDTFGHEMGDRVLQETCTLLRHLFKGEDSLIRLGGDEFLLILKDCDASDWTGICQRLSSVRVALVHLFTTEVAPTLSAGICFSNSGLTQELCNLADEALYNTKKEGRSGCTMVDEHGTAIQHWRDENSAYSLSYIMEQHQLKSWRLEMEKDGNYRLIGQSSFLENMKLPKDSTPEQVYESWHKLLHEDAVPVLREMLLDMEEGNTSEVIVLWRHPDRGWIRVRVGGTKLQGNLHEGAQVYVGYYQMLDKIHTLNIGDVPSVL